MPDTVHLGPQSLRLIVILSLHCHVLLLLECLELHANALKSLDLVAYVLCEVVVFSLNCQSFIHLKLPQFLRCLSVE